MSIYKQVDEASFEHCIELWNGAVPEWADSKESLLYEIAYALAQSGSDGIDFLKANACANDIEKRRAALWFLADPSIVDEEILCSMEEAFHTSDLGLKTTALWGYIRIEQFPFARSELEELMRHSDERISALAMVYLSCAHPAETVAILQAALTSPNPRWREYACDQIGDKNITELKPLLLSLFNDPDQYVRQAAQSNSDSYALTH